MTLAKPIRKLDPDYLAWVRLQPSVVSGLSSWAHGVVMEANHIRNGRGGGVGTKPNDSRALPFTVQEHRAYHDEGAESFAIKHGLVYEKLIEQHNRRYAKECPAKPRKTVQRQPRITVTVEHCECKRPHKWTGWKAVMALRCYAEIVKGEVKFGCPNRNIRRTA